MELSILNFSTLQSRNKIKKWGIKDVKNKEKKGVSSHDESCISAPKIV